MTKSEFVKAVAETTGTTQKNVKDILAGIEEVVYSAVKNDEEDDTNEYYESFVSEMFFTYKVIRNIDNVFFLIKNSMLKCFYLFCQRKRLNHKTRFINDILHI